MKKYFVLLIMLFTGSFIFCQTIELPAPQKTGGMPLMETLAKRTTVRSFDTTDISLQQLSDLLWASFGVNRSDGKRTAPSANNKQEIDIYVLLKTGAFVYDAQDNKLTQVATEDLRKAAASQKFAGDAPVQLIFIADLSKSGNGTEEEKLRMANIDCGYVSQNTYLYCTSAGLVTGARASINRDAITAPLKLKPEQKIILAHSVGFQKK
ncbi:MAG: SagB/ThcOx family dehydrogenase [Ignavibacteriaceae bacterium]|nr:SagB/ThcOx family dehydrogenase [Ignavibacteriaceae bacterium]